MVAATTSRWGVRRGQWPGAFIIKSQRLISILLHGQNDLILSGLPSLTAWDFGIDLLTSKMVDIFDHPKTYLTYR